LRIANVNSLGVDYNDYYGEIATEDLGGTVTIMKLNDTESWIKYDINPSTTSMSTAGGVNHIILGLDLSTYGSPDLAQDGTIAVSDSVCVSFDLFRRKKDVVSPNTPEGGVVVATADAEQPSASSNIVITGDNITITGATYVQTKTEAGLTSSNTSWYTIPKANARGLVLEYVISKTNGTAGYRTGQIMAVWDDSTGISYTDTSTKDVPGGGSTAGCSIKLTGNATNALVGIDITSDTFTVTVHIRALGTYS
jgi:hypothetical protein